MFTAVESGPSPKPVQVDPKEATKLAKAGAKAVPALVDAATEALEALNAKLREVADARRDAGEDAPGIGPATLRRIWVLRYGGELPDLTARYLSDVRQYVEMPSSAVRDVAEYLGRGANDGQLHELRQRERHIKARKLTLRALTEATVAGEMLTAKELAERAIAATIPPGRRSASRREEASSWLTSRSRD